MKDHFLENCTKVCRVKCYFSFSKICNILADFWRRPTTPVRVLSSTARTGQMLVYISIRACRVPPDPFVYFNDRWWTCLSIVACARLVMLWIELSSRGAVHTFKSTASLHSNNGNIFCLALVFYSFVGINVYCIKTNVILESPRTSCWVPCRLL